MSGPNRNRWRVLVAVAGCAAVLPLLFLVGGCGSDDTWPKDNRPKVAVPFAPLYCFAAIKGGEYRRDEMRRRNVSAATVDSLVERGYLKRNRAGATQITTQGKNARTLNR